MTYTSGCDGFAVINMPRSPKQSWSINNPLRESPCRSRRLIPTSLIQLPSIQCFETLAWLAPQHEVVVFQRVRPHPEEATKWPSRRMAAIQVCDSGYYLAHAATAMLRLRWKCAVERQTRGVGEKTRRPSITVAVLL